MNTGQVISGAGHAGLIAWALIGGAFQSDPLPLEVTEVTAISAEEYAALVARPSAPDAVADVDTPEPPQEGEAPALSSEADAAPELTQPEVAETPPPDEVPEVTEPQPAPEAEVTDEPPVLEPPQEDVAVMVPEVSARPQARPAPRVAPEPVAQPEPDVQVDEVERPEVTPDEAAEDVQPESEASAPEEATTEIVTEAEDPASAAPSRSVRPKSRPAARPEPAEEPATQTAEPAQEAPQTDDSAVADALAEALGQSDGRSDSPPQGPPLTAGEKDALRVAVQQCWNVGSLSSEALQTTVVVAVEMGEDAKPVTSSIRMLSSSGGSGAAANQAFEAARRAIIRCGASGYNLPIEKYDHWRDIEMTFNPERMRIK